MAEIIARLLAVLVGFAVAMLGLIYAIHSQDIYLGILIMVGGIASMHMVLPQLQSIAKIDCFNITILLTE